jgi:hypothetical protein
MKKLFIALVLLFAVTSCAVKSDKRYTIKTDDARYHTDSYNTDGNCITFTVEEGCGCSSDDAAPEDLKQMKVCGNFTITTN